MGGRRWVPSGRALDEEGAELPESEQPALVALRSRTPVRAQTIVLDRGEARRVWLRVDAVPVGVRPAHGASHVVSTLQDMTAARENERQAAALARFEHFRALAEMSAGVAHDLRHYFTLIHGHAEIGLLAARQVVEGRSPAGAPDCGGEGAGGSAGTADTDAQEEVEASFEVAMRAAWQGANAVEQLRDWTRPPRQEPDRPVQVAVGELLREVAIMTESRWRTEALARGTTIRLHIEAGTDAMVEARRASLHDAILNLTMNAVDAVLERAAPSGTILLAARRRGPVVELDVTDTGSGMGEAVRKRVLEPFFTTKGARGTGLGLVQVSRMVDEHGGELGITSAPGIGTSVRIVLPAVMPEMPPPMLGEVSGERPRVLAVDDDPEMTALIRSLLAPRGYQVSTARTAEQAIDWLARRRFDLVISDLGLGENRLNGWDLADQVRRRAPTTRFVLLTGHAPELDAEAARRAGVDAVLPKPFQLPRMYSTVALLTGH